MTPQNQNLDSRFAFSFSYFLDTLNFALHLSPFHLLFHYVFCKR